MNTHCMILFTGGEDHCSSRLRREHHWLWLHPDQAGHPSGAEWPRGSSMLPKRGWRSCDVISARKGEANFAAINNHVAPACFPREDDDLVTSFPPGKVRQISQLNNHVAPACFLYARMTILWRHFRQYERLRHKVLLLCLWIEYSLCLFAFFLHLHRVQLTSACSTCQREKV